MRVVRIYHAGRDASHRERDRALAAAGVQVTLVVPRAWPEADSMTDEPFEVVEVDVLRPGDVNRHRLADPGAVARLVRERRPDVVDLHEEPVSAVVRQLLEVLPADLPVVGYTAQNIDKRYPPPFHRWQRAALQRLDGLYPCSRQAASVAVGAGFTGPVAVLPLAPSEVFTPGEQTLPADPVRLLHVGRLVRHKGALHSVRVAATLAPAWPVHLTVVGEGPEADQVVGFAAQLGVRITVLPWVSPRELAAHYRSAHVLLAPSSSTRTWVEQYGRMVAEGQACGAVVAGYASGALPEVVGDAGLLVPERDTSALAGAVATVLADPMRWNRLRQAGFDAATGRTWAAVARRQVELYAEAVAHRRLLGSATARVRPHRLVAAERFGGPATDDRPFAAPQLGASAPVVERAAARLLDRRRPSANGTAVRVLYLDHVARMSGGEIALARLIAATPDVEAHALLGEDGPLAERLAGLGVRVEVLPLDDAVRDARRGGLAAAAGVSAAAASARYLARLGSRIGELRPEAVHTNSLKAGFLGVAACAATRTPVVWHLRDRLADDYLPAAAARATRVALRRADLLLANSAATLATAGRPGVVLPDPYAPSRPPVRRPHDGFVVGVLGRIAEWKGQDVVLRALAAVPDARLRVVGAPLFGEDDHLARLRALTDELGVADRVEFVGHVDDVEDELAGWDVLVHASVVPEPFGQVVVEGLAAGLAVVATAAGGPAELLTDGVDGLLVPPGDPSALAATLRRLQDPTLREQLAAAGSDRAAAFDPDVIGPRLRAIYRSVVGH